MTADDHRSARRSRVAWLDAARGIAVVAMVIYHLSWDLSFFGHIEADVAFEPGWRLFAQTIAASFLGLSGISLAFGVRGGLDFGRVLRRAGLLAGAAAIVTAGSHVAFPDRFIFFGILHCLALTGVLALAFLRLPTAGILGAAVLALALPRIAAAPVFNHPALVWTGLATHVPPTNDFVPLLPWFGFVLLGLAAGRVLAASLSSGGPSAPAALTFLGRHSLLIYLVHQPLLFGLFLAYSRMSA